MVRSVGTGGESEAMNAATTTYGSILEKPLKQLTEEDISQLTREDCRKYLKDKGSFFFFALFSFPPLISTFVLPFSPYFPLPTSNLNLNFNFSLNSLFQLSF